MNADFRAAQADRRTRPASSSHASISTGSNRSSRPHVRRGMRRSLTPSRRATAGRSSSGSRSSPRASTTDLHDRRSTALGRCAPRISRGGRRSPCHRRRGLPDCRAWPRQPIASSMAPLVSSTVPCGWSRSRPIRCASGYSPASWARQFPATTGRQPQATSPGSPLKTSAATPLNSAAKPGELSPRRRRSPRTVVRGRTRRRTPSDDERMARRPARRTVVTIP